MCSSFVVPSPHDKPPRSPRLPPPSPPAAAMNKEQLDALDVNQLQQQVHDVPSRMSCASPTTCAGLARARLWTTHSRGHDASREGVAQLGGAAASRPGTLHRPPNPCRRRPASRPQMQQQQQIHMLQHLMLGLRKHCFDKVTPPPDNPPTTR